MTTARTTTNRTLTIFSVPPEIRAMIWDAVLEDGQVYVGPVVERLGRTVSRRFISALPPNWSNGLVDYPQHPLEFVHSAIQYEFRERLRRWTHPTMNLGPSRIIPAGIFNGILHLWVNMRQAMFVLQVIVPNIQTPFPFIPPNTPLVLANAPQLLYLDISWRIPYDNLDFGYDHWMYQVGLARLSYFNRSFRVVVHWESRGHGIAYASGTLLDTTAVINHIPGIDANYNAYGLDHRDQYTNLRNTLRFMTQNLLYGPTNGWVFHAWLTITDAHPWHDYVPLGFFRGYPTQIPDPYQPQPGTPYRLVRRPIDP